MRTLLNRRRLWCLAVAAGGGLFALQGCDPAVRDTVLGGVGTAATSLTGTFIQAFIESLKADNADAATTVKADVDFVPQFFA